MAFVLAPPVIASEALRRLPVRPLGEVARMTWPREQVVPGLGDPVWRPGADEWRRSYSGCRPWRSGRQRAPSRRSWSAIESSRRSRRRSRELWRGPVASSSSMGQAGWARRACSTRLAGVAARLHRRRGTQLAVELDAHQDDRGKRQPARWAESGAGVGSLASKDLTSGVYGRGDGEIARHGPI